MLHWEQVLRYRNIDEGVTAMYARQAVILGYRRGPNDQNPNQVLLRIEGVYTFRDASRFIGTKLVYRDRYGNVYRGKIIKPHGRKGVVRAVFEPNLPGQAIGDIVEILEK